MAQHREPGPIEHTKPHTPVMVAEAIAALAVQPGGRYIDCTVGCGGHAKAILDYSSPGGQLLGLDADPEALKIAEEVLEPYSGSFLLVHDNFVNLEAICHKQDFSPVHGILFDLGLSSLQLDSPERGFSFQRDAPLDMRFNPHQKLTAAQIVNTYSEAELASLLRNYGEERLAYRIARRIVEARPLSTTLELARIVEEATPGHRGRIHPATRTFQALRIAVNSELDNLREALRQAVGLLGSGGRLVVISYHSLEDRIVKTFFTDESRHCICPPGTPVCVCRHAPRLSPLTRKPIRPSDDEVARNPRSRSARMRVAERIIARNELSHLIHFVSARPARLTPSSTAMPGACLRELSAYTHF